MIYLLCLSDCKSLYGLTKVSCNKFAAKRAINFQIQFSIKIKTNYPLRLKRQLQTSSSK